MYDITVEVNLGVNLGSILPISNLKQLPHLGVTALAWGDLQKVYFAKDVLTKAFVATSFAKYTIVSPPPGQWLVGLRPVTLK